MAKIRTPYLWNCISGTKPEDISNTKKCVLYGPEGTKFKITSDSNTDSEIIIGWSGKVEIDLTNLNYSINDIEVIQQEEILDAPIMVYGIKEGGNING